MSRFRFFSIFLILFFSIPLRADHFVGGHMSYNCIERDLTFITLSLMVETNVSALPDDWVTIYVYYKENETDDYLPLSSFDMDETERIITQRTLEAQGFAQSIYGQPYLFTNGIGYYKFVYQRCCRTENMVNIEMSGDQGASVEMEIYHDGIEDNCSPFGDPLPKANSYIEVCYETNQLQFEIPTNTIFGDSLSFQFCVLKAGGTANPIPTTPCDFTTPRDFCPATPLVFKSGYSASEPFGLEADISLDANTGIISGEMPNPGYYHFGICVDEFLNGVKVKRIEYDFQLRVRECEKICERNILITSQTELDSFVSFNCIPIKGDLEIVGAGITDLSPLSALDSIYGSLKISSTSLTSLEGLNNLIYIGGSLKLDNNEITNIDALSKLTQAKGGIDILQNPSLTSVQSLSQINRLEGTLRIWGNPQLTSLQGLENIDSIFGDFNVSTNQNLSQSPTWTQLTFVSGSFIITNNNFDQVDFTPELSKVGNTFRINEKNVTAIHQFNKLESVQGFFTITLENEAATQIIGFNQLDSVGKLFQIEAPYITQLAGFQNLTKVGSNFNITNTNQLITIEGFEKLQYSGSIFFADCDGLETLPSFNQLDSVYGQFTIKNCSNLQSITGFNRLQKIGNRFELINLPKLTSVNAFSNLESIGTFFKVSQNEILSEINGFENLLLVGGNFDLEENSSLATCTAFCNFLRNGELIGEFRAEDNAPACSAVISGCAQALVKGNVYYDLNQNGIKEEGERGFPFATQQIQVQPDAVQALAHPDGDYIIYLDEGSYSLDTKTESLFKVTNFPLSLNVSPTDTCINLDIGLYAETEITAGESNVALPDGLRCNSTVRLNIQVTNTGSVPFTGKLALVLDDLTSLSNAITPTLEEIGDSLLWSIEDLFLGDSEMIRLTIHTASEQFTGDLVQFGSYLFDESDNEISSAGYETLVRCSYDPNDKATSPQRGTLANYTLFEEDLTYTIRFENTGNDTAFLVRISDVLDEDLDWSTFKFIQASHPLTNYTLTKEGQVIFTFADINLLATMQDSTQSMGYVQYGISPKADLAENTLIENKASIYFDSNPPIITNTVINTMVSELPTFVKYVEDELGVDLYPNPFNQELFLETQQSYSDLQLRVFNLTGQLVFEKELSIFGQEETIDLPPIGKGLFIFQVVDMESGRRSSFRMFKED